MHGVKRGAALAAIWILSLAGCEDADDLAPAQAVAPVQTVASPKPEEHSAPGRDTWPGREFRS